MFGVWFYKCLSRSWHYSLIGAVLLIANQSAANGGWVIEREDRGESPILKDQQSIALTPEQRAQQALAVAYREALATEQEKIRQHWPNPEVSGKTRWVVYTQDYSVKKVVDFEHDRFEISIDGIYSNQRLDFPTMAAKVQGELEAMLATTIQQALNEDPIQQTLDKTYAALGERTAEPDVGSRALVLKLLFNTATPSEVQIREEAAALMRNASIRYQALTAALASVPVKTNRKLTYVIPLPDSRIRRKVIEYDELVASNAQRFDISADIIMAIIHTESHFNPLARSHIPAFGLMQIVPATAGRDASRKLYRKPKLLTAQFLYNPKQNIQVGSAYLNLLYFDYLKAIKSPESRLYYTIAAYNGGASNVAKAFTGKASFQDAVAVVNDMTPKQVLERLTTKVPSHETRQYLKLVLQRRALYSQR